MLVIKNIKHLQLYVKCVIMFRMRLWFQTFVSRVKTILEYDNCQVEEKMELFYIGPMHKHVREKFENDPRRQHYEKVYTACCITPNAKHNPSKFYLTVLSEAVRNLKDPDYKNYRYRFISKRFYKIANPEDFKEYVQTTMSVMNEPGYESSYIVAHAMKHGVAVSYQLEDLLKELETAIQTGDWSSNTSFSFSLVSNI